RFGCRGDPARDRFRRADIERTAFDFAVELRSGHRWPATFGADPVAHCFVIRPKLLTRLVVGLGDITVRMHTDLAHYSAELCKSAVIEIDIRTKAIGIAANDSEHQRQIVMGRANDGFRTAADANPGFERAGFDRRKYALIGEGRARLPLPHDRLV